MSQAQATKKTVHAGVPLHRRGDPDEHGHLAKVLESRQMEYLILFLVLCDVCCVAIEAGIDMKLFCVSGQLMSLPGSVRGDPMELSAHPMVSRPNPLRVSLVQQHFTVKTLSVREEKEVLVCEGPEGPRAERITGIAHVMSVAILFAFLVELLLKVALHGRTFFESAFEVLDLVVVVVSLICDVIIEPMIENSNAENKGKDLGALEVVGVLLILMRCWRVVRIAHGFYEIQYMENERAIAETEEKDAELEKLRATLKQHKIDVN